MRQVRALLLDSDGTLLQGSFPNSRFVASVRRSVLRNARWLYVLGEILDAYVLRTKYTVYEGARDLIQKAKNRGVVLGVVTDRSLFSFVKSAQSASFELHPFEFIHARKSVLDRFAYKHIPNHVFYMQTKKLKNQNGSLDRIMRYLSVRRIKKCDVLLVGDSKADTLVAAQYGIGLLKVDKNSPNFLPVVQEICREQRR